MAHDDEIEKKLLDRSVLELLGGRELLKSLEMVETVKRVSEPFKQANRKFHPKDTIVEAGGVRLQPGSEPQHAAPEGLERGIGRPIAVKGERQPLPELPFPPFHSLFPPNKPNTP